MTTTALTTAAPTGRERLAGGALILAAAAGYGIMPLFATQAHRAGLDAPTTMAGRFAVAAVGLWLVVLARKPERPQWTTAVKVLVFGGVCWAVQSIGYMVAVTKLGASLATLLIYTYPLMVVVFSVVTGRQRLHRSLVGAGGLVVAGLLAVFALGLGDSGLATVGFVAGAVTAATYAVFILASEPLSRGLDPFLFTALGLTGAAASTLSVVAARGGVEPVALVHGAGAIAGLGVFSTVVAATAFLMGLRKVGAATASVLSCTEVVVACTVAAVALGDRLGPVQLVGCAAILAAAIVLTSRRKAG